MKKIIMALLPIIGITQSCSNKDKIMASDLEKRQADTLLLRKSQPKNSNDSAYLDNNPEFYSRPIHAAHFSSNTPHFHKGHYHNGNY